MHRIILTYHGINDQIPLISTRLDNFIDQITHLKSQHYAFLSIPELLNSPKNCISIVFDDGLKSILNSTAYLIDNKIPFGIALISNKIGVDRYLSMNDLKNLLDSGLCTLFSHSMNHECLDNLSEAELLREVIDSKHALERIFGVSIDTFVYPFGRYNNSILDEVKKGGYSNALSLLPDHYRNSYNRFLIPRICIDDKVSFKKFKLLTSRWGSLYLKLAFIKRKIFGPHYLLNR